MLVFFNMDTYIHVLPSQLSHFPLTIPHEPLPYTPLTQVAAVLAPKYPSEASTGPSTYPTPTLPHPTPSSAIEGLMLPSGVSCLFLFVLFFIL